MNVEHATITLPFKGKREYAHGTDIFNALLEAMRTKHVFESISQIDLVIRKSCLSNIVSMRSRTGEKHPHAFASFECSTPDGVRSYEIVEESSSAIQRIEFDEDVIARNHTYDEAERSVSLPSRFGFATPIETVVILNKVLHGRVFPQPIKWLFVRFQCPRWMRPDKQVGSWRIQFVESLGTRLTKSEVYLNEVPVGTIWFSGVVEKK